MFTHFLHLQFVWTDQLLRQAEFTWQRCMLIVGPSKQASARTVDPQLSNPHHILTLALFLHGFVLFAHQSRIDISRTAAIRDVTGHIIKGAGLLTGWTFLRSGPCSKGITTIGALPLRHLNHLLSIAREFGVQRNLKEILTFYSELRTQHSKLYLIFIQIKVIAQLNRF